MDFDIKQHFDQLTPENSKGPYKLHSSRAPAFLLPFLFPWNYSELICILFGGAF